MPAFGTRTVDRTQDLLLVRQTLIPAELYGYVMRVHLRHLSVRFARVGIGAFDYLRKIEEKTCWWTTRESNPPLHACKARDTPLRLLAQI